MSIDNRIKALETAVELQATGDGKRNWHTDASDALNFLETGTFTPGVGHAPAAPAPTTAPPAAPAKRGRGRPVTGETPAPAAPAPAPVAPAPVETDPFAPAAPVAAPTPSVSLEEVRDALTKLKAATTQDNALAVLKNVGGASNLSELKATLYASVVAAAVAALPKASDPVVEADPFETPTAAKAPAVVEKEPTLEEVKAAVVAAQKRTSTNTVQALLMAHGGKAAGANGVVGPSLRALPLASYTALMAAMAALPATK